MPSLAAPASVTSFDLVQSVDTFTWTGVPQDLGGNFEMVLDPTVDFYYLDVQNLVAISCPGQIIYHPFFVTSTPPGWTQYWADQGVVSGASGWQGWMYQIITGTQPIFYLRVTAGPNYMLVDGLDQRLLRLRILPCASMATIYLGDYTFTGTITDTTSGSFNSLPVNITFSMIQRQLNVNKSGTGSGTVTSNPAGIDCGATCQFDFDHGTVVTMTAAAATGSTFAGWEGEGCSGSGDCTTVMTGTRTVTATFTLEEYTLTVNQVGNGTVSVEPVQASYHYGDVVTMTATADPSWRFSAWSGDLISSANPVTMTMDASKIVTATFILQHELTVVPDGTGSGTVTSEPAGISCGATCVAPFDENTVVTLTAAAATGSTFTGWTGEGCSGTGDCTVTMTAAKTVTATFTLDQFTLTVAKDGTGSGTVTSNPAGIDCGATCQFDFDYGTVVTLTATAATGSTFAGWTGEGCSGTGSCTVSMTATRSVTATFTLNHYRLSVSKVGSGNVTSVPAGINCGTTCAHDFDFGTVVTLTATPAAGWSFFGWEGDETSTANPLVITIDGAKSVTAVFEQHFVFLPLIRLDPPFSDSFNYDPPETVLSNWQIFADPSLPSVQNATWVVSNGEFHGTHTRPDKNSKVAAKIFSPRMPGAYSVDVDVKLASGSDSGARGGLLFDLLDNNRTYRFVIMPGLTSGNNWQLQVLVAGTWTTINNCIGQATNMLPADQYNHLRVERQADSIKIYLNDLSTPLCTGSDTTYQNGQVGLNIGTPTVLGTGAFVEVVFDNFVIGKLP